MKKLFYLTCSFILSLTAQSQLNLGGLHANFGVDADTRSGSIKFGPLTGNIPSDDWFPLGGTGRGVLDTSNASVLRSLLQNRNISFTKNMSVPLFSRINGKLWLDAIYLRDYCTASGSDSTAFGTGAKNGTDPRNWDGKPTSVPGKTDLVDTYAHFRRDGIALSDSLWFFTGASTLATQGDRYFDIELFKNAVSYNPANGKFSSAGLSNGHTEWIFDPLGNIIQTGDLIIAVSYKSGQAPEIDVRIWVSKLTYNLAKPSLFKFGKDYDGGPLAGYATILSKTGNTSFGSGIGNVSASGTNDTTYSTPWGTSTKSAIWANNYESLQFVEIGLNFTRMGIDVGLYNSLLGTACDRIFHSVFFKSRSSNAFSANLQDFAGPINFSIPGLSNTLTIKSDTLTCIKNMGTLAVLNTGEVGVYKWTTLNGNILNTNQDSSIITVDKIGLYTLTARLAVGCSVIKMESVTVPIDNIPPVATGDLALTPAEEIQLIGGDPKASDKLTPFGRSKGLKWDWVGPNAFTSSLQSPIIEDLYAWGAYQLTLTEERNGCIAMAPVEVSFSKLHGTGSEAQEVSIETLAAGTIRLWRSPNAGKLFVITNQQEQANGRIVIFNTNGQSLGTTNIQLAKGFNRLELPMQASNQARIVCMYIGNKLVFTRKLIF